MDRRQCNNKEKKIGARSEIRLQEITQALVAGGSYITKQVAGRRYRSTYRSAKSNVTLECLQEWRSYLMRTCQRQGGGQ